MVQYFKQTLNATDFNMSGTITALAGKWTKVGYYSVNPRQQVHFGSKEDDGLGSGAPVYIKLQDSTPAVLDGKIRLVVTNPQEINTRVIVEERTERFYASQTDRQTALLMGLKVPGAKEDDMLQIHFYPDSSTDVTISVANSTVAIPTTVYQLG